MSQVTPRSATTTGICEEVEERSPSRSFRDSMARQHSFRTSRLQNYETTHFCHLKPLILWRFIISAQGDHHRGCGQETVPQGIGHRWIGGRGTQLTPEDFGVLSPLGRTVQSLKTIWEAHTNAWLPCPEMKQFLSVVVDRRSIFSSPTRWRLGS